MSPDDTIFALASAPGKAGVAVLRVSGPAAGEALGRLTAKPLPAPRRAARRRFVEPDSGAPIDEGLALWFPAPASFTGEDVAELHLHGGRAVLAAMLRELGRIPGCRLAEPGEFTKRAFLNGRLDLTAAEGLADLVAAETEAQRRLALRQLEGELGALYESWRERLLGGLARLEAAIDFPDEDLPAGLIEGSRAEAARLAGEIARHLADERRGERIRDGLSIAILGPPNSGKSSIFNMLIRREAAIVSAVAGTTRDVIEAHLDLGGFPVVLADTAGLRLSQDEIEAEGVNRALKRAAAADLCLVVLDASRPGEIPEEVRNLPKDRRILVANKSDIASEPLMVDGEPVLAVSARTAAGIPALLEKTTNFVTKCMAVGASPVLTRARHREALEQCRAALARAEAANLPELLAEDLRLAVRALGRITGRVGVEEILDRIFAEFCIGK
jgi:tRNA modification GTPase